VLCREEVGALPASMQYMLTAAPHAMFPVKSIAITGTSAFQQSAQQCLHTHAVLRLLHPPSQGPVNGQQYALELQASLGGQHRLPAVPHGAHSSLALQKCVLFGQAVASVQQD